MALEAGHEAAIENLLRPWDSETLVLDGWKTTGVHAGPDCSVTLDFFSQETRTRCEVRLDAGRGALFNRLGAIAIHYSGLEGAAPPQASFRDSFEELISANDPGYFFQDRCNLILDESGVDIPNRGLLWTEAESESDDSANDPGEEEPEQDVAGEVDDGPPWIVFQRWTDLAIWLLLLACIVTSLLLLGRRIAPTTPQDTDRGRTPWRWGALEWTILGGLLLRAALIPGTESSILETESWPATALGALTELFDVDWFGTTSGSFRVAVFTTPFVRAALGPWVWIGDQLGFGGHLVWLRLPNLILSAWFMISVSRLGRMVAGPSVGLGVALLSAFSPWSVTFSLWASHHFWETVAAAWFMERLAAHLVERRSVDRSLAISGALALWVGPTTGLIIAPGYLLYLLSSVARGSRRGALATTLLFGALVAPIAVEIWEQLVAYWNVSVAGNLGREQSDKIASLYGHSPISMNEHSPVCFLWRKVVRIYWESSAATLALLLAGCAVITSPKRAAPFVVAGMLYAGASKLIFLGIRNSGPLLPVFIILPFLGVAGISERLHLSPLRPAVDRRLVIVLLGLSLFFPARPTQPDQPIRSWASFVAEQVFGGRSVQALFDHLRATPEGSRRILVVSTEMDNTLYPVCGPLPTGKEIVECIASGEGSSVPGVRVTRGTDVFLFQNQPRLAVKTLASPDWCGDHVYLIAELASLQRPREDDIVLRASTHLLLKVPCDRDHRSVFVASHSNQNLRGQ